MEIREFLMPLQTDPPKSYRFHPSDAHHYQAFANHDQSLVKLASRGGMSLAEMAAIIQNRSPSRMTNEEALEVLNRYGTLESGL